MEYRTINHVEWEQAERLNSIAYWYKTEAGKVMADPKTTPEMLDERSRDIRAAIDETGKLCAKIEIHPYDVYFDGSKVGMGGIGGVATRPECRRGGHIRRLMTDGLAEMNERGMVFSYPFPFSFYFYGKFGYDPLCAFNLLTAPVEPLLKCDMKQSIEQYHPGMPVEPFYEVYNAYASKTNMMVARTEKSWAWHFKADPEETLSYYWLTRDEAGKPTGYVHYSDGDHETIRVREMVWTSDDALETMMAFFGRFTQNKEKVVMKCMPGMLPEIFWPNLWNVEGKLQHCGMNRVINAEKALTLMKKPWFPGSCVVEIHDETAPWNTGSWKVEWADGESKVTRCTAEGDIVLNANSMNALICGRLTPAEAARLKTVEVRGNERMLEGLFIRKAACITDSF